MIGLINPKFNFKFLFNRFLGTKVYDEEVILLIQML